MERIHILLAGTGNISATPIINKNSTLIWVQISVNQF
jgi:hypothetical protein